MMKKIIAFLCVFMYFASPYKVFGHAMPEVIGLIAILLQLTQAPKLGILKGYGAFFLYMLFIPPLVCFVTRLPGNYLTSFLPVTLLFYSIAFCVLLPNLDMGYVLKYYKILVYAAVALFFIQEIGFHLLGTRPTLYLPLEMYYDDSTLNEFAESRASMDRSSSFFLEPAHFAQYILPYYCIVVYNVLKNKKFSWEFLIFTAVLLLLQSGCGYVGLLAIFVSVLFIKGLVPKSVKIGMVAAFAAVLLVISYFFINNPIIVELLSRIDEVSSLEVSAYGSQSGFLRVWRGYFIYGIMAPIYKICGIGVGSIEYISGLLYIPGSRYEGAYMNGIQALLVTGGLIGTFFFTRFFSKNYKGVSYEGRIVLICMIAVFFVEQMLFTPKMFLYILIAIAVTNNYHDLFRSYRTIRR